MHEMKKGKKHTSLELQEDKKLPDLFVYFYSLCFAMSSLVLYRLNKALGC